MFWILLIAFCVEAQHLSSHYFNSNARINFFNASATSREISDTPSILVSRSSFRFGDTFVTSVSNESSFLNVDVPQLNYQISLNEFNFLNGPHPTMESFSALALFKNIEKDATGTVLYQTGTLNVQRNQQVITFAQAFDTVPVVLTQLMDSVEPIVIRLRMVSTTGFTIFLEREQGDNRNIALTRVTFAAFASGNFGSFQANRIVTNRQGQARFNFDIDSGLYAFTQLQTDQPQPNNPTLFAQIVDLEVASQDVDVEIFAASPNFRRGNVNLNAEIVGVVVFNESFERIGENSIAAWVIGETGLVPTDSLGSFDERRMLLSQELGESPIVVADRMTANAGDDFVVGITNIQSDEFELRIIEWEYLDGPHPTDEVLAFLAMREGEFTIEDDAQVKAGKVEDLVLFQIVSVRFENAFNATPVVLTSVVETLNPLLVRITSVTPEGFTFFLQTEEALLGVLRARTYIVHWIAFDQAEQQFWEASSLLVGDSPTLIGWQIANASFLITNLQSTIDQDPAYSEVIQTDFIQQSALVQTEEEQSLDQERNHADEIFGYVAMSDISTWIVTEILVNDGDAAAVADAVNNQNDETNSLAIGLGVGGGILGLGLGLGSLAYYMRKRKAKKAEHPRMQEVGDFERGESNFNGDQVAKFKNQLMNQYA